MPEKDRRGVRVKGTRVAIDETTVRSFFAHRHEKQLPHRLNYTNYQDAHPELALVRDAEEKAKILPMLDIHPGMRVIDIGCGVGRWSTEILAAGADYVGVDYEQSFLDLVSEAQPLGSHGAWVCSDFQHVTQALADAGIAMPFDRVIINGIFMYINDADIPACLSQMDKLLSRGGALRISRNQHPARNASHSTASIPMSLRAITAQSIAASESMKPVGTSACEGIESCGRANHGKTSQSVKKQRHTLGSCKNKTMFLGETRR